MEESVETINEELRLIIEEFQVLYRDCLSYNKNGQSIGIAKCMDLVGRHFKDED